MRGEVRVQVERPPWRRYRHAGRGEHGRDRPGDRPVQPPGPRHPREDLGRLGEGERGGRLHRRGRRGPDLAAGAQQRLAKPRRRTPSTGRQSRDAEPPPAERQVLGGPGGDDRPVRRYLRRAQEIAAVRQVPVDLVGDDEQVVALGHSAQRADRVRRGQRPRRVIGQRDDHRADPPPLAPGRRHRGGQQLRVRHAALAGQDRHVDRPDAGQRGLRGVTDPARPGNRHVRAQVQQQPVQQRLAPRAAHHVSRSGRQAAPRPVPGGCRPQFQRPGDRTVRVDVARTRERVPQHRGDRHSRLAERQRQHPFAAPPSLVERLVRRQCRGEANAFRRRSWWFAVALWGGPAAAQ